MTVDGTIPYTVAIEDVNGNIDTDQNTLHLLQITTNSTGQMDTQSNIPVV